MNTGMVDAINLALEAGAGQPRHLERTGSARQLRRRAPAGGAAVIRESGRSPRLRRWRASRVAGFAQLRRPSGSRLAPGAARHRRDDHRGAIGYPKSSLNATRRAPAPARECCRPPGAALGPTRRASAFCGSARPPRRWCPHSRLAGAKPPRIRGGHVAGPAGRLSGRFRTGGRLAGDRQLPWPGSPRRPELHLEIGSPPTMSAMALRNPKRRRRPPSRNTSRNLRKPVGVAGDGSRRRALAPA